MFVCLFFISLLSSVNWPTLAPKMFFAIIEVPDIGVHHVLEDILERRFMGLDCILRRTINRYSSFFFIRI